LKEPPGEFELISRLCAKLRLGRQTILGPGDDCAIFKPSRQPELITIDSMVEGVHFNLEWTTPEKLGARALAVNLSDIAAMGGRPRLCVVNLAIRPGLGLEFFDRLYAGLGESARIAAVDVAGGNITRADQLAITIALLGQVETRALRRDTARPGDGIYVTGTLGDAALGLGILSGKVAAKGAARDYLVGRFLTPAARLEAGRKLARIKPPATAIDISDGLWQDLGHLLERSNVGAEIDSAALPLSDAYRAVSAGNLAPALSGGDDYELLFCLREQRSDTALSRRLGLPVRRIGTITSGRRALIDGLPFTGRGGWDQLRARTIGSA
jgi:thiamine-monophosphate kinase